MVSNERVLMPCMTTDERLFIAIIEQDKKMLKSILQSTHARSSINKNYSFYSYRGEGNHSITLLAVACHYGCYDMVDYLVTEFRANINQQNLPHWQTALHHAVLGKCNQFEIVQYLLRNGAHVDARDRHGTTPLMLAVLYSYTNIVRLLLEQAGANVRLHNQYHLTAFDFVKSNTFIINDLIRNGAFIDNSNKNLDKLFDWLLVNKHQHLVRLLIEAGYHPKKLIYPMATRSLKRLCRFKIRQQLSGSFFRRQILSLPVNNKDLIKYILLDDF